MPAHSLTVSLGWYVRSTALGIWVRDEDTGLEEPGLPAAAADLEPRLSAWADLVREHYAWVDGVDATAGWRDEDMRRWFVVEAGELSRDLLRSLGRGWRVYVSPEPGVNVVGLAGEHFSHWPLWVRDGGTEPEDWPMLSPSMLERLERWAELAEPDRYPGPAPDVTQKLRVDLARELGPRFRLRT
jgi:hypothetical protein